MISVISHMLRSFCLRTDNKLWAAVLAGHAGRPLGGVNMRISRQGRCLLP